MNSIWNVKYIVIDVETTGPSAEADRITDIACVTSSGGEIVSQFSSLINPHKLIPPYIVKMTGITNEMAFSAPEADLVLSEVKNILEKEHTVFVAHNLSFDYGFVKASFARCGIEFDDMPRLCTLKLARRLLRKDIKKNVGSLAEYFGIRIKNRHRALGDASATAKILAELLEIAEDEHSIESVEELITLQNKQIKNFFPPSATFKRLSDKLEQLPDMPGVYYFKDNYKDIHYVGKAKSLKERVGGYFHQGNITSRKISAMLKKTHYLDWQTTESELSALILESKEIKALQPYYNTLDKNYRSHPFIKLNSQYEFPSVEITRNVESDGAEYFGPFKNAYFAESILENINKQFKTRKCTDNLKISQTKRPCFYYHISSCEAPCCEKIGKNEYMLEIQKIRLYLSSFSDGIIRQMEAKMRSLSEDLEFEKAGQLKTQIIELKKLFERNPLDEKLELIEHLYFNGTGDVKKVDEKSLNEVKIINSWVYKHRENGAFIYIEGKKPETLLREFQSAVRNYLFTDELETAPDEICVDF